MLCRALLVRAGQLSEIFKYILIPKWRLQEEEFFIVEGMSEKSIQIVLFFYCKTQE